MFHIQIEKINVPLESAIKFLFYKCFQNALKIIKNFILYHFLYIKKIYLINKKFNIFFFVFSQEIFPKVTGKTGKSQGIFFFLFRWQPRINIVKLAYTEDTRGDILAVPAP